MSKAFSKRKCLFLLSKKVGMSIAVIKVYEILSEMRLIPMTIQLKEVKKIYSEAFSPLNYVH
jgi:hypothetical protein